jgi:hypothetical protein
MATDANEVKKRLVCVYRSEQEIVLSLVSPEFFFAMLDFRCSHVYYSCACETEHTLIHIL